MSDELDLDAIEARVNAATPGPWAVPVANVFRVIAPDEPHNNPMPGIGQPYPWRVVCDMGEPDGQAADAAFIANARTDVLTLIAEVRRLRVENEDEHTAIRRLLSIADSFKDRR